MPRKKTLDAYHILAFILGIVVSFAAFQYPVSNGTSTLSTLPQESMKSSAYVVAVTSDGGGLVGSVDVEVNLGRGRVLMNTNPFLEPDTQFSAETATQIAEQYTKKSLDDRDVIYSFDIDGQVLGGPSAGAAMTVATIAAIEGKQVRNDVAITGTIEEGGKIGFVGGVLEKMQAASEKGVKLFLVPEGQTKLTTYERIVEQQQRGGFVFQRVRYVPKTLDLSEYAKNELNIEVREVSTIGEVASYMLE